MNTDTVDVPLPEAKPGVLVDHVTFLLQEAGVENPEAWKQKLNPEAFTSLDVNVQRFHINRRWVDIFTSLPTEEQILETRNARGCLMGADCKTEDWSRLFKMVVIPCAIQMQLLTVK